MTNVESRARRGEERELACYAEALTDAGYADYCASFNPLLPRPVEWGEAAPAEGLPTRLAGLVRFYLLGLPVAYQDVVWDNATADGLDVLVRAGLVDVNDAELCSRTRLLHLLGLWHFSTEGGRAPVVYVGDDSMALLTHSIPRTGARRALDLCAGGGIQSLWLSRFVDHVDSVEQDPAVCRYAQINAMMNGLSAHVTVRSGDLYEPVAGTQFDHVTANPPLVPVPADLSYPPVGDGGPDGLDMFWRIVHGLPPALSERGVGIIIGTCFSDSRRTALAEPLRAWAAEAAADVQMTIMTRQRLAPGQPFFDAVARAASAYSRISIEDVEREMLASFATQGGWLASFVVRIHRGTGTLTCADLADRPGKGPVWFTTPDRPGWS